MFGYVKPYKPDLLVKDFEFYRATYCGICRAMKKTVGVLSPAFLAYDSVFLALCRMVFLPDDVFSSSVRRCVAHPVRGRLCLSENDALTYTARAFACLSYHKLLDDLSDESAAKRARLAAARPILEHARGTANLPELDGFITGKLALIRKLEEQKSASVDDGAGLFGELLAAVFSYGTEGTQRTLLSEVGDRLGRFIYAADAAEDYDADVRRYRYNPYAVRYGNAPLTDGNKETIRTALDFEVTRLSQAVDLFPFGTRRTLERLIRNITAEGLPRRTDFLTPQPKEDKND